jgi:hypothetical protein
VVYDPAITDADGCTSRGFAVNCAATLYVDGTDQGPYYPYTFPGDVASTAALQVRQTPSWPRSWANVSLL